METLKLYKVILHNITIAFYVIAHDPNEAYQMAVDNLNGDRWDTKYILDSVTLIAEVDDEAKLVLPKQL